MEGWRVKVLFINHKDVAGGAAVAAYRLARGLETYHRAEYRFLVYEKTSSDPRVVSVCSSSSETAERVKRFTVFLIDRIMNKLGLQYLYFPFPPFILFHESSPKVWAAFAVKLHISCSVHTTGARRESFRISDVLK